jgi:hypothetical protein
METSKRSDIIELEDKLIITIPADKNRLIIPFLIFWIIWFIAGLSSTIVELFFGKLDPFELGILRIFWMTLGAMIGVQLIFFFFWGYFGIERIIIENETFNLYKTVFKIGVHNNLKCNSITNIRLEQRETSPFASFSIRFWGLGPGKIKLDYGNRTYSFGISVDKDEAIYISELLENYINQRKIK